jgi:hypothetical protein
MPPYVREVLVQGQEGAALADRVFGDLLVGTSRQVLLTSGPYVVTTAAKDDSDQVGNVLVQLDQSHSQAEMGTIRSRARSAA